MAKRKTPKAATCNEIVTPPVTKTLHPPTATTATAPLTFYEFIGDTWNPADWRRQVIEYATEIGFPDLPKIIELVERWQRGDHLAEIMTGEQLQWIRLYFPHTDKPTAHPDEDPIKFLMQTCGLFHDVVYDIADRFPDGKFTESELLRFAIDNKLPLTEYGHARAVAVLKTVKPKRKPDAKEATIKERRRDRDIWVCRKTENMSYESIADRFEISKAKAKACYHAHAQRERRKREAEKRMNTSK